MMHTLICLLQKHATGKTVALWLSVTIAVYMGLVLYTVPSVLAFAPGMMLFDLSPAGYSHADALALLRALGAEGRDVYLTLQLPLDFIYPGLFAISTALLLTWLFGKTTEPASGIFYVVWAPILTGLLDYMENISIVLMLNAYPDLPVTLVEWASRITMLKSLLSVICFVLLTWGLLRLFKQKRKTG